jgi:hypothetical protein
LPQIEEVQKCQEGDAAGHHSHKGCNDVVGIFIAFSGFDQAFQTESAAPEIGAGQQLGQQGSWSPMIGCLEAGPFAFGGDVVDHVEQFIVLGLAVEALAGEDQTFARVLISNAKLSGKTARRAAMDGGGVGVFVALAFKILQFVQDAGAAVIIDLAIMDVDGVKDFLRRGLDEDAGAGCHAEAEAEEAEQQ